MRHYGRLDLIKLERRNAFRGVSPYTILYSIGVPFISTLRRECQLPKRYPYVEGSPRKPGIQGESLIKLDDDNGKTTKTAKWKKVKRDE